MTDIVERLSDLYYSIDDPNKCCLDAIDEIERLRKDIESLNQMLRDTGYGQGQIDAYAAQCEEIERLRKENKLLRLGWCKESEKRMKECGNGSGDT